MKQQGTEQYFTIRYDKKERFFSYWYQINEIAILKPARVLEVGIGSRFSSNYLKEKGVNIVTVDVARGLRPDVQADVLHLPFGDGSFDVVACFELLEHLTRHSASDEHRPAMLDDLVSFGRRLGDGLLPATPFLGR